MVNKNTTGIQYKSINAVVKEVDFEERIVKGYFSSFGVVDSDADRGNKGMFANSINQNGPDSKSNRKIAHLAYHDLTRPSGKIIELKEDDFGLYFASKMGTHRDGDDALRMYKEGIIREHSYGFEYIPDKMEFIPLDEDKIKVMGLEDNKAVEFYGGIFDLMEVKLYEGSYVVFGANSETPNLSEVKNQEDLNNILDNLDQRVEILAKAIKDGNYQEKYSNMFDVELKQIQRSYKDLINFEPSGDTHKADTLKRQSVKRNDQFILNQLKNTFNHE